MFKESETGGEKDRQTETDHTQGMGNVDRVAEVPKREGRKKYFLEVTV